jgi:hypothetical protein
MRLKTTEQGKSSGFLASNYRFFALGPLCGCCMKKEILAIG